MEVYHDIKKLLNIGGCLDSAMLRLPVHEDTLCNCASQNRTTHVIGHVLLIQCILHVKLSYEHIHIGVYGKYLHENT